MTEFVYLHGFASSPSSKKATAFKNKFKEVGVTLNTPDLEGGNFENMTLTSQVKIVLDLLDQFQCKKVCLIGSSMGGYLATLVAQRRVEIKATYLMAPGFNFLERWMRSLKLDWGKVRSNLKINPQSPSTSRSQCFLAQSPCLWRSSSPKLSCKVRCSTVSRRSELGVTGTK